MNVEDFKDIGYLILIGIIGYVAWKLSKKLFSGEDSVLQRFIDMAEADISDSEQLKRILKDLEEASPSEEEKESSHQKVLQDAEERSDSDEDQVKFLRDRLEEAEKRKSQVSSNLEDLEEELEDVKAEAQSSCSFNPEIGLISLVSPLGGMTAVLKEGIDRTKCEALRSEIAIKKKTKEKLEKAVNYWDQRIDRIQDKIDSLEGSDGFDPIDPVDDNKGDFIDDPSLIDDSEDQGSNSDEDQPDDTDSGGFPVSQRWSVDMFQKTFYTVVEVENNGSDPMTAYVGFSSKDSEDGRIKDYDIRAVEVDGGQKKQLTFADVNSEFYRASVWRNGDPSREEDRLADTGWRTDFQSSFL